MTKPSHKTMVKYAVEAVREELRNPNHGRLSGYDRESVNFYVLQHFDGLDNSDEDHDLIEEAVREAERIVGVDEG
jgi:hypothetical protein